MASANANTQHSKLKGWEYKHPPPTHTHSTPALLTIYIRNPNPDSYRRSRSPAPFKILGTVTGNLATTLPISAHLMRGILLTSTLRPSWSSRILQYLYQHPTTTLTGWLHPAIKNRTIYQSLYRIMLKPCSESERDIGPGSCDNHLSFSLDSAGNPEGINCACAWRYSR